MQHEKTRVLVLRAIGWGSMIKNLVVPKKGIMGKYNLNGWCLLKDKNETQGEGTQRWAHDTCVGCFYEIFLLRVNTIKEEIQKRFWIEGFVVRI